MLVKNDPKVVNGWAFYDWANSVYNLVITSAIFPIYFESSVFHETKLINGKSEKILSFLGREFINTELYSYVFSASFVVIAILVPLLSGIADYLGNKKRFLQFFCYLGAAACISLFWFDKDHLGLSLLSPFFASIGFWGSLVFYNSYLPEIASPDQQDRVSAKGFALGYIGSVLLLVAVLFTITNYGEMYMRYGFVAVGLWWAGFAQITYRRLPKNVNAKRASLKESYIFKGFQEINKVLKELFQQRNLARFLLSFFVYNMGVQTIMLLAPIFAASEINWPVGENGEPDKSGLIISIILIQLVAIVGAITMSKLSTKIGNFKVIRIVIVIWIIVCGLAYFTTEPIEFYFVAAMVGFVMGGIQSMSRSTYSKMLPVTKDNASYFSFYDVLEKIGLIIGPFIFGFVTGNFGGMRNAVLILALIFVVGFILMFFVKAHKPAIDGVIADK
jgi:MFS transporter, UMF1 family